MDSKNQTQEQISSGYKLGKISVYSTSHQCITSRKIWPQIDGLRCLAIMPVIFYHYGIFPSFTSGGFGGVDVFFVISGFLVNSIIISELLKQKFSLLKFYQRRVRRLFPAIFTTLILCLIIGYILYFEKYRFQELVRQSTAIMGSVANFYFYMGKSAIKRSYFSNNVNKFPFLHFWSLAVQQQFYMITPIALMLLMKYSSKSKYLNCMLIYSMITIVISLIFSIRITQSDHMFAFYLLPCRAWELGLGGLIAIILHSEMMQKINKHLKNYRIFQNQKIIRIILQILSWGGLLMILVSYVIYRKNDKFPGYKALLPCCGVAIYIAANFVRYQQNSYKISASDQIDSNQIQGNPQRKTLLSAKILSFRPIVWIGQISYSLYLWHWPIWSFFNYYYIDQYINLANKTFCLSLTFILAYLSTQEIQNPIRNKNKVTQRKLWIGFSIIWVTLMAILILCRIQNVGRYSIYDLALHNHGSQNSTYPDYDDEGFYMKNPYRSLKVSQIDFQNLKKPPFTSKQYRNDFGQVSQTNLDLQPKLFNYKDKTKPVCLGLIGSSHTQQHIDTLRQLALQYNVSMAILTGSASIQAFFLNNRKQWDQWRMKHLALLKPKIIFSTPYWFYLQQVQQQIQLKMKYTIDPLLELETPPQFIGFFGDNSYSGFGKQLQKESFGEFLIKKSIENNGWQFMQQLHQPTLSRLIETQQIASKYISQNYDKNKVKFYTHLHRFLQDQQTGAIQLVGSQVGGKLLYKDNTHLSIYGSLRFKKYFQNKIFQRAKQLCK